MYIFPMSNVYVRSDFLKAKWGIREWSHEVYVCERHVYIIRICVNAQTKRTTLKHHIIEGECPAVVIRNEHSSGCIASVGHNRRIRDSHVPGAARRIGLNSICMIARLSRRFEPRIADVYISATSDTYGFP
jgi:hypothetical protein